MQYLAVPSEHEHQRPVSRRDVLKSALSAPVLVGLGGLTSMVAAPKASAANSKLIDFAERLVPADQVAAAGYAGALVYVSELRPGATFDFKPVSREYADALRAAGLHVVSCYQFGKPGWPTPSDFTRGYDGGVADAQTALGLHAAAGGPDSAPIFFSIDEDIDAGTWKSVAAQMASKESTRCWAWSAPVSTGAPGCVDGPSATASSGIRQPRDIGGRGRQGVVARSA